MSQSLQLHVQSLSVDGWRFVNIYLRARQSVNQPAFSENLPLLLLILDSHYRDSSAYRRNIIIPCHLLPAPRRAAEWAHTYPPTRSHFYLITCLNPLRLITQ